MPKARPALRLVPSPSTGKAHFARALRRLGYTFLRSEGESVNQHERDLYAVTSALSGGDAELAREVAACVEDHAKRKAEEADKEVRRKWIAELSAWDGSDEEGTAQRFVRDMSASLLEQRKPRRKSNAARAASAGRMSLDDKRVYYFDDDWAAVAKRVRKALWTKNGTRPATRDKGRALVSAGLRAMGLTNAQVKSALSTHDGG